MKRLFRVSIPRVLIIVFISVMVMTIWWQYLFLKITRAKTEALAYSYLSTLLRDSDLKKNNVIHKALQQKKIKIVDKCDNSPCLAFKSGGLEVSEEFLEELDVDRSRLLNMLNWEAGFLLLVLTTGCAYFIYNIFAERKRYQEQITFLSMAAHELKRPVNSLNLLLESLQAGTIPAEKLPVFLHRGLEEIEELSTQLEKTLKLQEIQVAAPQDDNPYELSTFLKQQVEKFQESERVLLYTGDISHFVTCNKKSLGTIIDNLVENALKYSDKEVKVTIKKIKTRASIEIDDLVIGLAADENNGFWSLNASAFPQ